ncbi:MAG: undecaprenyldiphospho-muramoylpentapeptide beta-N-acetylglucosaminyltransferase [Gammaproteobacteria bacterium]|nr:undecaprenyldiphospho-muramoylpentapeptide beta-N-acetylglucosaminyltransferase [Gammaproteobacteria bacterium]
MLNRVLIMAGGTGGHVFPALAVAQALKNKGVEVTWLGTQNGLEADVVPKAGFEIDWIRIRGLRGNGLAGWTLAPIKLLFAGLQAAAVIRKRKPDVVIGMGGFVTGPGGFMAWLLQKPVVIHEQNAIPGLTNRLLANLSKRVLEAFPGAFSPSLNAIAIGNPVREELFKKKSPAERFADREKSTLRLLVVGGSLGARAINLLMPEVIKAFDGEVKLDVWHQTGKKLFEETQSAYKKAGDDVVAAARVAPFIDDMAEAYAWADIVLCRAGALTVSELAAVGVGSILVPFPHAVDDHQTKNASFLVDVGAAKLLPQHKLSIESLKKELSDLTQNRSNVLAMAEAAFSVRQVDSVDQVLKHCYEVANV